jgi:Dolichyl-phosphate-mannose-protein mannosyltransferase
MDTPSEATPPANEVPAPEPRGLQDWKFPLAIWLGSRVFLLFASWTGMALERRFVDYPEGLPPTHPLPALLAPLCRWDCTWYFYVAKDGYASGPQTNWFPLLPKLTHALWVVTRIPPQWGMILVANAACLGAYWVLFRMFRRLADEQSARWGVALFAAYPFAFFHAAGFPESLMVLLSALALDYALRGQHFRAGLALAVGILSRHLAMVAGLGLLVAQVQQRPSLGRFFKSPAWLALALPWLSLLGYCVYQQLVWGDFLAFYKARELWGAAAYWGITDQLRVMGSGQPMFTVINSYLPWSALGIVGVLLTARHRDWWSVTAFGLALSGVMWAVGMWALGRYSASCWPAFLGWGVLAARRPTVGMIMVGGLGMMQGMFFFLFMHQYSVM